MQVFKVLHQDGGLVASPVAVAQSGHQAARIDLEELGWFAVNVYFDVLVRQAFELEGDPDALHKWAKAVSVPDVMDWILGKWLIVMHE